MATPARQPSALCGQHEPDGMNRVCQFYPPPPPQNVKTYRNGICNAGGACAYEAEPPARGRCPIGGLSAKDNLARAETRAKARSPGWPGPPSTTGREGCAVAGAWD